METYLKTMELAKDYAAIARTNRIRIIDSASELGDKVVEKYAAYYAQVYYAAARQMRDEMTAPVAMERKQMTQIIEDGWEYETREGPRKGDDPGPPDGDGWEPDLSNGYDGKQAWQRFNYHEEYYWKRRK